MKVPPAGGDFRHRRFGDKGTAISEIGETALLEGLIEEAQRTVQGGGNSVVVSSGDDAAVWRPSLGALLVVTQDAIVENIDYRPDWTLPHLVGRRSLTISLSDIASMGAEPAWCVATYCARPNVCYEDLLGIQQGLCDVAAATGCAVIGGDVSRIDGHDGTRWIASQLDPVARLAEGAALSDLGVRCCGDLSDGLLIDTERTARSCNCAAELWLDVIPVDPGIQASFANEWIALAVGGGEDFELLAAAPDAVVSDVLRKWSPKLAPLTVIGQLVAGSGVKILDRPGGVQISTPISTSRHF
jgi:thiamine-monophosphate kinase